MAGHEPANGAIGVPGIGRGPIWVPEELDPRNRLAFIADRQRGRVERTQLLTVGVTPDMIRRDLRTGALRPRYTGVYVVGHTAPVPLGEEVAALLAIGRPVALADESATALWEIQTRAPREVHVIVPREHHPRSRPGIVVHRSTRFNPGELTFRHGLPVTTPERALLDLSTDHDAWTVEGCFDEALHRRLISPTKIRHVAARHPHHPGARLLLALADPGRAKGPTKSEMERRALRITRAANVPDPERNYPIEIYTIDLYWPRARYGLELDSWQWHAGPKAFKRDRRKSARMKDLGIELDRVTDEMLNDPVPLIARIVRTLEQRTREAAA